MLSYLYYIFGYNYDETTTVNNDNTTNNVADSDEYIDKEIMNIKINLKKAKPLKKQFYCPTINELNYEINKIKKKNNENKEIDNIIYKNSFIPSREDLIKSKNKLKKCKKEKLIKKTFSDELKFAKLNLKKTTIDYRIENFCNAYLDKFEKKNKYRNYVLTI